MIRKIIGGVFFVLFVITLFLKDKFSFSLSWIYDILSVIEIAVGLYCFVPRRESRIEIITPMLKARTAIVTVIVVLAVIFTIYAGVNYFGNRRFFLISVLIIAEILIPFIISFERCRPSSREIVIISVMCALAVCGRAAFFWLPQFKPTLAIIIISAVAFGGEAGFLVGVVTAFASNFFFGQGAWTPWQMLAMGLTGLVSGMVFSKVRTTRLSLCIFGFMATVIIYGGIVNAEVVLVWQSNPTWEMILSTYLLSLPFDLAHAVSTVCFLWFLSEPLLGTVDRIKTKYGI